VAFSDTNEKRQTTSAYVQIRKNTFVELHEANAQRPLGINLFGVHVENMNLVLPMFKQRAQILVRRATFAEAFSPTLRTTAMPRSLAAKPVAKVPGFH